MEFAGRRPIWAFVAWLLAFGFLLLLLLARSLLVGQAGLGVADLAIAAVGAAAALTVPWIVGLAVSFVLMRRLQGGLSAEESAGLSGAPVASNRASMDRFDKFSGGARGVLTGAQEEAQRLDHHYIGTEHLLLGLVREGEGPAGRALQKMGVELDKVRIAVEFIIGRGGHPTSGEVGLTPRAKRVIELAIDEARLLGAEEIGSEHLLLGLLREGEGIAAGVLESLGVRLDQARAVVLKELGRQA